MVYCWKNYWDRRFFEKEYYNQTDYFDKQSDVFLNLNSRFQRYRIKNVLSIYTPKPDEVVLDIGCAWGTFEFVLAGKVKKIIGLDISEKSIELCNRVAKEKNIVGVEFVCEDARNMSFADESIDTIICADVVEHLYPDIFEDVMKECHRVLKKGGKFIIWTPNRGHILEILKNHNIILKKDPAHVDYKSMKRIVSFLQTIGFKILKQEYRSSHIPIFNIFEKVFQSFVPILRRRIAVLAEKVQ